MGLISDLAVLVGNGVTVDTIKEIVALEKGGVKNEGDDTKQKDKQGPEDKPDDKGTETPPEGDKAEPTVNADTELKAELEAVKKELAESKAQIASMQEANKHRNRDDDSHKSSQDLLNDIMLDMY